MEKKYKCISCGRTKSYELFPKNQIFADGKAGKCNACTYSHAKEEAELVDAICLKCGDKYRGTFSRGICPKCKGSHEYTSSCGDRETYY